MFYLIIGGFVVGVFLQTVYSLSLTWWLSVGITSGILLLGAWRVGRPQVRPGYGLLLVGVVGCMLVLGAFRLEYAQQQFATTVYDHQQGTEITLRGVVRSEPDVRNLQQMLSLQTADTIVLVSTDRQHQIRYGDKVEVTGVIERPTSFSTEFGRTFDYAGYLQADGIAYRMSFAEVAVLERGYGNPMLAALLSFKYTFMRTIATLLPEPAAGLSAGLLLGVKQALGTDLETAFRKTGIIHIVVLSGYNVMLVVAFVTTILGYFLALRARVVVGVVAITAFALTVGLSATVVRASIMACIFLCAKLIGRTYQVLRALFLAGAVMVWINPFIVVYDIGFQLSFMATLGLLLVAPRFEVMLMQVPQWLGVRDFFIATVATQIAVLPILLYQVGELSIVSVPVNMLVLPMVPVAMLGTFITGLVAFVSTELALLIAYPTYLSLQYIIVLAEYFSALPFAAFWVPMFSFWWVPVSYAFLGSGLYLWWRRTHEKSTQTSLPVLISHQNRPTTAFSTWTIEAENAPK